MIRLAIADDELLIASSLGTLLGLEEDIEVIFTAGSGEEIHQWWNKQHTLGNPLPEVCVLDLHMKGMNGLDTATVLRKLTPHTAILIITRHARPQGLRSALEKGMQGFLPKTATAAQFAEAVRTLHSGGRYIDPELAAHTISAGQSPLTPREAEVIEAAGKGGSAEDIATMVHLAPGTTRNYLSSAMRKLGAQNRFEAYMLARERGWI
ncbi:response regulator transcription factor [Corynebacterium lowii]|uniref:Transcriptional regulatory protein UhpA n=1 Tax=Corynebacterium lowii TaxID=1544413 RepID=A0A0Q0YUP0_9CORY|nr:response regulator transcription factor [Corynebacterium lowii]KQB86061.1 Transcriptional regulatory protein UhpA [Corynebacterium lowii]MDP9852533.1 two-component system response regulator DesR [Corynebacterium lowii]